MKECDIAFKKLSYLSPIANEESEPRHYANNLINNS